MKKVLLVAELVEESETGIRVRFDKYDTPMFLSKSAISKQSKRNRKKSQEVAMGPHD